MIVSIDEKDVPDVVHEFDFIFTGIPDEVEPENGVDERNPIAYFTDGDSFAHYQQVNVDAYDVLYIGVDDAVYGSRAGASNIYRNKSNNLLYKWHDTQEGLEVFDAYEGFTWTINTNTRWKQNDTFTRHIAEAIAAYAMAAWLRGRLDDRVTFYDTLFNNSLNLAIKNIFTKQPPKYESVSYTHLTLPTMAVV